MQVNSNNEYRFEGKLVSDPKFHEFDRTDKNTGETRSAAVVRFTISAEGGKDGSSTETAFVPMEAWDTAADRIGQYRKGDLIAGIGILRNNKFKDKQTGEDRKELVVRVSRFYEVNIRSRDNEYQDNALPAAA